MRNIQTRSIPAYTLLLTAYSSGSPIKIMRCYGNGVVALGMGQGSL
ncbi:hypothetical protein XBFFL1_1530007 [Xenorhabdus bovienii str. feltiae Florida]|nr:hypothetical protein XBFFR1_1740008 [Xenorhabdus bovienii str. feltiae France]CDG91379.1 hypothetical protein XBFFL1_1530007 [Xenorhabdus bovienii str. feltiae Florida]